MVIIDFETENYTKVTLYPGIYNVQLWGAQGGRGCGNKVYVTTGGKGAYVSAVISVKRSLNLFAFVGSQGGNATGVTGEAASPGWNGGGRGGPDINDDDNSGGGGGATDLRLNGLSLEDRIMVAAGGSGSTALAFGAPGGNTMSYTIDKLEDESAYVSSTKRGPLGQGEDGKPHAFTPSSGAGGGYYGGIAVDGGDGAIIPVVSYSGTSFIAGYPDQDPMSEKLLHEGIEIYSRVMKAGFEKFPTTDSKGIEKGHQGNGCISIDRIIEGKIQTASVFITGISIFFL